LEFHQLSEQPDRRIYIVFDRDENQAGQSAECQRAQRLAGVGVPASAVSYQPDMTRTVTLLPEQLAPISANVSSGRYTYETHPGPSYRHTTWRLSISRGR
jgi:hypothetical protein